MKIDLSFWRVVLIVSIAKGLLWAKSGDTYFLHIGMFTDGKNTALKFVFLPLSICVGFVKHNS